MIFGHLSSGLNSNMLKDFVDGNFQYKFYTFLMNYPGRLGKFLHLEQLFTISTT